MKKVLTLVAIASLMFSCSEKTPVPETEKIPINISVGLQTRANDSAFETEDEIGLYVVNYDGATAGTLKLEGNQADNTQFTFDGSKWNSTEDIYWKDQNTPADFYAYYPYSASITSVTAHAFGVQADQSVEDSFWASDFLWGKSAKVSPTPMAVPIKTSHVFSRIVLDIKPGNGFTDDAWEAATKSVSIQEVKTSATIDLSTGVATATGSAGSVIPFAYSASGTTVTYRAMIVPQVVADNSKLVVVTVDGVDYVYRKGFTFNANTEYKFAVTVNKTEGGVDMSIGEWTIDENLNEGEAVEENEGAVSSNQIWYKASEKITPVITQPSQNAYKDSYGFGANIISNEWDETTGEGIITFDGVVTHMGNDVFAGKTSLIGISVPNGVKKVQPGAFLNCTNLNEVHISSIEAWCNIYFEQSITTNWPYSNPLYYAKNLYLNGELITDLVIPDGVTEIPNNAFHGCANIQSVTIGKDVEYMGQRAFAECSSLAEVVIPNTDHTIRLATNVFELSSNLTEVILGNNITDIPTHAFYGCSSLGSITIPDTVTEIGNSAFGECASLASIYCKPTTPPAIYYKSAFPFNSDMKIYVPRESYEAYTKYSSNSSSPGEKAEANWAEYKDYIQAYDF